MSLTERAELAAYAMMGLLSQGSSASNDEIAQSAVALADALLQRLGEDAPLVLNLPVQGDILERLQQMANEPTVLVGSNQAHSIRLPSRGAVVFTSPPPRYTLIGNLGLPGRGPLFLERNGNYPPESKLANWLLMYDGHCIGGINREDGDILADIAVPWFDEDDEANESDCTVVYEGDDFVAAVKALFDAAVPAIVSGHIPCLRR